MQIVHDFLKKCGAYYLATVDGDLPRVRPFGTVNLFEGKLYILTGTVKEVSKQMAANPRIDLRLRRRRMDQSAGDRGGGRSRRGQAEPA
jgi:uncharacterized pyridoxamine 5'-phosphate oxidase family protein